MKFGSVAVEDAEGTVLAHSVKAGSIRVTKGHVLTGEDVRALSAEGVTEVVAGRLEAGDELEDAAAGRIAAAILPDHLRFSEAATGRVNIYAKVAGLFVADRTVVDALNAIDPSITLACLADHVPVSKGEMVATVKIIPLAVASALVDQAVRLLSMRRAFEVKPFKARKIALVATELPSLKPSVMDKTYSVLAGRLARSGSRLAVEQRVAHRAADVAAALLSTVTDHEMIIVFGASAVCDADDVIPAAIRAAGGVVEHVGMPVDPGNLLVLGRIGDVPVIGAPGCARSPRENGFDWVLNRILAGEMPTGRDIAGMGVGGLLMEIPTRPLPRDRVAAVKRDPSVGIVLLAAGSASRMGVGGPHKLLAEFGGEALVRRSAVTACASSARSVVAVTGHRAGEIEAALSGLVVKIARNPDFASGMASSLVTGLAETDPDADGMLVMLADMPGITSADLDRMIAAFVEEDGQAIIRAVSNGKRGNPVILPRATFAAVRRLEGDVGARHIIEKSGLPVIDIDLGPAAHLDVDTPQAVLAAGGVLKG